MAPLLAVQHGHPLARRASCEAMAPLLAVQHGHPLARRASCEAMAPLLAVQHGHPLSTQPQTQQGKCRSVGIGVTGVAVVSKSSSMRTARPRSTTNIVPRPRHDLMRPLSSAREAVKLSMAHERRSRLTQQVRERREHRGVPDEAEARAVREALAASERPYLIGVRHHSPACAAAMSSWLDAFSPTKILLELPPELQEWLGWLADPLLEAPVALAAVAKQGGDLVFYPFADFSPELATLRWARAAEVPVEAFDLGVTARPRPRRDPFASFSLIEDEGPALLRTLLERVGAEDSESLWDQIVETPSFTSEPERLRRAALLLGWALRLDAARGRGVPPEDLEREDFMRERLEASLAEGERVAVVVGAFHSAALLEEPLLWQAPPEQEAARGGEVVTSLIPYSFELLDSRSGYPAGIRDPRWQQRVFDALSGAEDISELIPDVVVEICRQVRRQDHVAGIPDSREAVRLARGLASLRGLSAPGRRELLESVQTSLGQGELLGRGRVLARAMERVLVGRKRGRLAPGTPRSGLLVHTEELLSELNLPGPERRSSEPTTMRLDPLRSRLDRRRHVALERIISCGAPYAELREGSGPGAAETLTRVWTVHWRPATEAMLELAGVRGVTLAQAAEGALRSRENRLGSEERLTAAARLDLLAEAAESGLGQLVNRGLKAVMGPFIEEAGLAELLAAWELLERIERGHVSALPTNPDDALPGEIDLFIMPPEVDPHALLAAAVRAVEGLSGSERIEDAMALLELVRLFQRQGEDEEGTELGVGRLGFAVDRLAREGSPIMQGAAGAVRVALGREAAESFGERMGSWVDAATSSEGLAILASRLRGALVVAAPLFEASPSFCDGLLERVEKLKDEELLHRLPALREGFETLSPSARQRLLVALGDRLGDDDPSGRGLDVLLEERPELLALFARADQAGRRALEEWGGEL